MDEFPELLRFCKLRSIKVFASRICQRNCSESIRLRYCESNLLLMILGEETDPRLRLRSIQHIFKECNIQTTCCSNQTLVDKGALILQEEINDPLGRVGNRKTKEKLALKGVHISR